MADEDAVQFEGASERYKYLLLPVKDLTTNFNIDIVNLLEEYIKKVIDESNVNVSTGIQRKLFNFTEAAMIIHSTTSIYGRKVEYVHQIALNFFDQLKEDNKQKRRRPGTDADDDTSDNEIERDNGDENGGHRRQNVQKPLINLIAMKNLLEKLSKKAPTLPYIPISFVPLANFEKSNFPLFNRTNMSDAIGTRDDFKINTCQVYEAFALLDLKNAQLIDKFSEVLPVSSVGLIDNDAEDGIYSNRSDQENVTPLPTHDIPANMDAEEFSQENHDHTLVQAAPQLEPMSDAKMETSQHETFTLELGHHNDESLNGGMDLELDDHFVANFLNRDTSNSNLTDGPENSDAIIERNRRSLATTITHTQDTVNKGIDLIDSFETQSLDLNKGQDDADFQDYNEVDIFEEQMERDEPDWEAEFAAQDPHELNTVKRIPFKPNCKCCTNAAKQVAMRNRRIERECNSKGIPKIDSVKFYADQKLYRRKVKRRSFTFCQFNAFLMNQLLLALNPLIYEEEKRRTEVKKRRQREEQSAARSERASARRSHLDPIMDNPEDGFDENDDYLHSPDFVQQESDPDPNNVIFEDPTEELVHEEIINQHEPLDFAINDEYRQLADELNIDDLENSLGVRNLYNDFTHLTATVRSARRSMRLRNTYDDTVMEADINPDDLPPRPVSQMEYDEIIAYHLRKYWAATEEHLPKVYERVQKWEAKITPYLEEEQAHREFHTNMYGDELLELFDGNLGRELPLTKACEHLPKYELSRYLLVSLIMTNVRNFDLIQNTTPADSPLIKLLRMERDTEILDMEQRMITG